MLALPATCLFRSLCFISFIQYRKRHYQKCNYMYRNSDIPYDCSNDNDDVIIDASDNNTHENHNE